MKIKYNLLLPIILIAFALGCGIMFFMGEQKGIKVDKNMYFIIPMLIVLSLPMLFVNYVVITEDEIIVNNQFGMVDKRYSFKNFSDLEFDGKKLFINKNGEKIKVKFRAYKASLRGKSELNAKINSDL